MRAKTHSTEATFAVFQSSRDTIDARTVTKTMDCLPNGVWHYWFSDADVQQFMQAMPSRFHTLFHALKHWPHKSDLWRSLLLYLHGGVYLDAESTLLAPLHDLLQRFGSLFVYDTLHRNVYNGFFFSRPRNPALLAVANRQPFE